MKRTYTIIKQSFIHLLSISIWISTTGCGSDNKKKDVLDEQTSNTGTITPNQNNNTGTTTPNQNNNTGTTTPNQTLQYRNYNTQSNITIQELQHPIKHYNTGTTTPNQTLQYRNYNTQSNITRSKRH